MKLKSNTKKTDIRCECGNKANAKAQQFIYTVFSTFNGKLMGESSHNEKYQEQYYCAECAEDAIAS